MAGAGHDLIDDASLERCAGGDLPNAASRRWVRRLADHGVLAVVGLRGPGPGDFGVGAAPAESDRGTGFRAGRAIHAGFDVLVSTRRDAAAARRFFCSALRFGPRSCRTCAAGTTRSAPTSPSVIGSASRSTSSRSSSDRPAPPRRSRPRPDVANPTLPRGVILTYGGHGWCSRSGPTPGWAGRTWERYR